MGFLDKFRSVPPPEPDNAEIIKENLIEDPKIGDKVVVAGEEGVWIFDYLKIIDGDQIAYLHQDAGDETVCINRNLKELSRAENPPSDQPKRPAA